MDKKRQSRYLLAVNGIVLFSAITLALVGVNYIKHDAWQSIVLNLSTELLGVALVFFLVNRFFLLDDWSVSERLDKLIERLGNSNPSAVEFFRKWPDLDSLVRSATHIDICGVTLTTAINKQFVNLRDRLRSGAAIRILVIDPSSTALKMSAERSSSPEDIEYYLVRLNATLKELFYLFKSWEDIKAVEKSAVRSGSLSVRLLSYAPSFGLISFNANQDNGLTLVEIYPHKSVNQPAASFDLTPSRDEQWYRYFTDQFDQMWNSAKPWEPKTTLGE